MFIDRLSIVLRVLSVKELDLCSLCRSGYLARLYWIRSSKLSNKRCQKVNPCEKGESVTVAES